jgi:mRNA (guanine-N7-)-methyltransferase
MSLSGTTMTSKEDHHVVNTDTAPQIEMSENQTGKIQVTENTANGSNIEPQNDDQVKETLRIKKRKIDALESANNSSKHFSARHERSATPETKARASNIPASVPSWVNKTKVAPAPWMSQEDVKKYEIQETNKPHPQVERQVTYDEEHRLAVERKIRREIEQKSQYLDQTVIKHYNKRAYQSKREKRDDSEIIKLRNYHNAIKFILIGEHTNPGERVLDLGCGKGGDLNKWEKAQAGNYIGIDISDTSIREAIRRFRTQRYEFQVSFITGDCFGVPLPTVLEAAQINFQRELPVDVVSMQFCMHYAFESEEKATTMIRNVAWALKIGGKFIGTIPNSDFIKYKLTHRKSPSDRGFGNNLYSVTFPKEIPEDGDFSRNPYGNVYNYYLKDAIDNVPEYVVPFDSFRTLAAQYGLDLIYNKPFAEMFKEYMPTWHRKLSPRMIRAISRQDGKVGLEGDEVEASAFYKSFVFVKIR